MITLLPVLAMTGLRPVEATGASAQTDDAMNRGAKKFAAAEEDEAEDAAIEIATQTGRNRSSSAEKVTSTTRTATTMRWSSFRALARRASQVLRPRAIAVSRPRAVAIGIETGT
jgi:hypothetical protein